MAFSVNVCFADVFVFRILVSICVVDMAFDSG